MACRIFSWFFDQGGVIPIVRGGGINQPGMDVALQLLNENKWFHIFSEGGTSPWALVDAHSRAAILNRIC